MTTKSTNLRPTEDPTNLVIAFLDGGKNGKAKYGDLRVAKDAPAEMQALNGLRIVVTGGMIMVKARGTGQSSGRF